MFTGFTGIDANTVTVDTVGDNLANLNTTAFKGQRVLFETLLYETIREGQAPGDTTGGTLPEQIGHGVRVAAIQRDFRQGGFDTTGFRSDLAIDGGGFFVVEVADGQALYTRDGAFHLDESGTMVSTGGARLQVFAADEAGNIDTGTLSDLVIRLGSESLAFATQQVVMDGRLDPGTSVASSGAVVTSQPLFTASGAPATESTALTSLVNANALPLFAVGDELTINGTKGGVAIAESTFVVGTTGSTVGDLADHLEAVLGIATDPATGGSPGVTVSPAGEIIATSSLGGINAVQLDAASIINTTGVIRAPLSFKTTSEALGGGVTTTFNVYDSLGNQVDVRLRASLESKTESGTTWRFYAESAGDSDLSPVLGTGTITFDPNGQFLAATGTEVSIDRAGEGSASPLTFTLDLSGLTGLAGPNAPSELIMASQDGAPTGTMTSYSIDRDGTITAVYSNQEEQVLGQVALATFTNDEGLVALSENTYVPGPNSGGPEVIAPLTATAGSILAGALEQSNVEIAREFIGLITASTGISVSSRVVRVADDLLQELLLIAR